MQNNQKSPSNVLYVINITLRLVAICAIIALLVATVNLFTKPVITHNEEMERSAAISRLFGGAEVNYEQIDCTVPEIYAGTVDVVYGISDTASSEQLGYCVQLSPTGFKGEVDLLVSFDKDAFITGVEVTATNDETSGIGTKVKTEAFTGQFREDAENPMSENVDDYIIAQATKTSKPVTESVFAAKAVVKGLIMSGASADTAETEQNKEVE